MEVEGSDVCVIKKTLRWDLLVFIGVVQDELLWAAAWLYHATHNQYYLEYLGKNGDSLGGTGWAMTEFSWDVKYAGVQTLVSKVTSFSNLHTHINHIPYRSLDYPFHHFGYIGNWLTSFRSVDHWHNSCCISS